jgi:ribosomal protein S18 acetylase RimI-like enzyme
VEIVPLTADRIGETATALAAAFRANPGFRAGLPGIDETTRERKLRPLFRSFVRTCRGHGEASIVLDGGRVAGASLCYGPGAYPLSFGVWLRNSAGALPLGPLAMLRLASIDAWMRKGHRAQPHWYLFMLGVEPRDHGRGFGGALLRRLSERADRDGVPAYLETDTPENVPLYERFGYTVTEEAQLREFSSLTMWRMVRSAEAR